MTSDGRTDRRTSIKPLRAGTPSTQGGIQNFSVVAHRQLCNAQSAQNEHLNFEQMATAHCTGSAASSTASVLTVPAHIGQAGAVARPGLDSAAATCAPCRTSNITAVRVPSLPGV